MSAQSARFESPFVLTPTAEGIDVEARTDAVPDSPPTLLSEHFNAARRRLRTQLLTGDRDDAVDRTVSRALLRQHRHARAGAPLLRLVVKYFLDAPRMRGVHRRRVRDDIVELADAAVTETTPRWRSPKAPAASVHLGRWAWAVLQRTHAGVLTSDEPVRLAWAEVAAQAGGEAAIPAADLGHLDAASAKLHAALPMLQKAWSRRIARDAGARSGIRVQVVKAMVDRAGWGIVAELASHACRRAFSRRAGSAASAQRELGLPNGDRLLSDALAVLARHGLAVKVASGPWWVVDAQTILGPRINAVMGWGAAASVLGAAATAAWAVLVR